MKPTVADSRTPNRLILRGPAGDLPPVTAEAAGSSPVVPAILFTARLLECPLNEDAKCAPPDCARV
jgi:hypothetical protein